MAKKYRILESFTYRGHDGNDHRSVLISPGEEVPKLDSEHKDRLLRTGKICEMDQYGENIRYKELNDLNDNQIDNLLRKSPAFIMQYLAGIQDSNKPLSKDTLARIYGVADDRKMPPPVLAQIEKYIEA